MKILILNYEFPPLGGGGSPVCYEIAKGYVKLGHDVSVVTMRYKDLPEYDIVEGIHVYRVPCIRSKKEICHPWEQLTYIASAIKFLKKHLKTHSYDINHTHFIIPTGPISLWLKKKYNIPYVLTSHGSDVIGHNKRFAMIYPLITIPWKKIVREAAVVTTPSDFLKNRILEKVSHDNIITIFNGINITQFKPLKKTNTILIVARLFINKGVQDILDALTSIDLKGWKVDIVGDGPYRNELEKKCQQNGLEKIVNFIGWIDHKDPAFQEHYGKGKIFISASYFESFGQTVVEAISSGCYPMLSDIEPHRVIVKEKKFLFQTGNSADLQQKIIHLLKQKNFHTSINISRFEWKNIIKNYETVLLRTARGAEK